MAIEIRLAQESDLEGIFRLVNELADYEKAPEQVTVNIETYIKEFRKGLFEAIVAYEDESKKVVGMALYYDTFSTWKGKMIYLEDFVITKSHRKTGLGQAIFDKFLTISKQKGAKLVKWQVLDWNEPAIKFYIKNNALIEKEWFNGKIFL